MTKRPNDAKGGSLSEMRVGILVAPGFEDSEVSSPRSTLDREGASTALITPEGNRVRSWHVKDWGAEYPVDACLEDVDPEALDALLLPGGVLSADRLRGNERARALVRTFLGEGRPVAAICHGPWLLVDTDSARGRKLTCHPRIANDLINAGAEWANARVVVDGNLVTSRKSDDLPAFNEKMVEVFARHNKQSAASSPAG